MEVEAALPRLTPVRWVLGVCQDDPKTGHRCDKKYQMTELDTCALAGMPVGDCRSPPPLGVPDARRLGDGCRAERWTSRRRGSLFTKLFFWAVRWRP